MTAASWEQRAACRDCPDPSVFFPSRGASLEPAYRYCRSCPVVEECLTEALSSPYKTFGVWGGTSERARREIRKSQSRAVDDGEAA